MNQEVAELSLQGLGHGFATEPVASSHVAALLNQMLWCMWDVECNHRDLLTLSCNVLHLCKRALEAQ